MPECAVRVPSKQKRLDGAEHYEGDQDCEGGLKRANDHACGLALIGRARYRSGDVESTTDSAPSPQMVEIRFRAPIPLADRAHQAAASYDSLASFMRHVLREWFREHRDD